MNKQVAEFIQKISLFKGIDPKELDLFVPLFVEKELPEGKTVFVENMPGESLYIIREGTVQVSKMIGEGREKTLVILGSEDYFGEMALLDGETRFATARVVENARLLRLQKSDFESFCEQHPRTALKFVRNVVSLFSQRIRENSEEYKTMLTWALDNPKNG